MTTPEQNPWNNLIAPMYEQYLEHALRSQSIFADLIGPDPKLTRRQRIARRIRNRVSRVREFIGFKIAGYEPHDDYY